MSLDEEVKMALQIMCRNGQKDYKIRLDDRCYCGLLGRNEPIDCTYKGTPTKLTIHREGHPITVDIFYCLYDLLKHETDIKDAQTNSHLTSVQTV